MRRGFLFHACVLAECDSTKMCETVAFRTYLLAISWVLQVGGDPPNAGNCVREVRTHCPDAVQLKVFPIYIALVIENGGFKNTSVNRPFSNHRKTLLSDWVGGDILGPLIFVKI